MKNEKKANNNNPLNNNQENTEKQKTKEQFTKKEIEEKTNIKNTCDEKIHELECIIEEKHNQLLRLQAEFINFRNRVEQEKTQLRSTIIADVLKEFVCVFDDFQTALEQSKLDENEKKGFELVYAKLISAGENLGLKKIPTINEQFNPNHHEVLLTEVCEKSKENQILTELQSGYMVNDKVIRTAKVKVAIQK